MGFPLKKTETYAYGDYLRWPEDERWELIYGDAYNMSAAPSTRHQLVSGELYRQIANFLSDKACKVLSAPFDVRLPNRNEADEEVETVVQPDISVICDLKKIDDRGCRGAPDFIAEITSPFTASKDNIRKVALYEKHGVKEYWIIHPFDNIVYVRLLNENGRYGSPAIYEALGQLEIATLPGLKIDLELLFR
ncbi:MAG: hypothetical protein BWK80_16720 [Desulfobacteraceae bacterium IS3]|nr:MAG: hypothetical protein BWK80_16720 [Desulfobacteraceae bacterium IS3]HAO19544.1 Uma2 family endonuclease [Desulfobacteraceae bacterium]